MSLSSICGGRQGPSASDEPLPELPAYIRPIRGDGTSSGQARFDRHCSSARLPACMLLFWEPLYVIICLRSTIENALRFHQKRSLLVVLAVPTGTVSFFKIRLIVSKSS